MTEPRSRPHEPFVSGVRDGVEHGYRALETVLEGVRGSIDRVSTGTDRPRSVDSARPRRRPATGSHDQARSGRASSSGGSFGGARRPLGELVDLVTELVSYAGEVAVDVADEVAGGLGADRKDAGGGALVLRASAAVVGAERRLPFHLHNRQPRATALVEFVASDLVGEAGTMPATAISFEPGEISIAPRGRGEVEIVVDVPEKTAPGRYRGVVHASLGDAWVVLDVEVLGRP